MRNISAAPDSVLAYHKLLSRFMVDLSIAINELHSFSAQGLVHSPVCSFWNIQTISGVAGSESFVSKLITHTARKVFAVFQRGLPHNYGAENEMFFIGDLEQEYTDRT
jgi:hypothetical protein